MRLVLVLLAIAACKSPGAKEKGKESLPTDPLARVAAMKPDVAKVRGLALKADVQAGYQTTDEFRAYVHGAVEKGGADVRNRSDALVALGLLPPSIDLGSAIEHAYVTQAAAYYDFATKRFFLVAPSENLETFDLTCAHELTHAITDQHYDLATYMNGAESSDALVARKFVVEGDAMLTSIAYLIYSKTSLPELTKDQIRAMRPKIVELAEAAPTAFAEMMRQQAKSTKMDPEMLKSLDAMASIPPTILVPLMDSYMKGAVLMLDAYEKGGWREIDALYTNPPRSTEQVLHYSERLLRGTDLPRAVTLPEIPGTTLVFSDVLGEMQWAIYFGEWTKNGERHAAQNWDGDRYAVVRDKKGKLVSLVATIWDSEYDAKLFHEAYAQTAANRYNATAEIEDTFAIVEHEAGATWMLRVQDRVYIVDGTFDGKILDQLVEGTTFK